MTDPGCRTSTIPLKEFTKLQELSWEGLRTNRDFNTLRDFLEFHLEKLTLLELDFVDWKDLENEYQFSPHEEFQLTAQMTGEWIEVNRLLFLIFPERNDDYEGFLPNLRTLSLSACSFRGQ